MNKEYCERIQVSATAILDGEAPQLSEKEVKEHLESCADCRLELEHQRHAVGLLDRQSRRVFVEDVWAAIAVAIQQSTATPKGGQQLCPFVVFGLILLAYKIIEVLPAVSPGVVIKLIPLGVMVLFFGFLKQNPFFINQNLTLKGDTR